MGQLDLFTMLFSETMWLFSNCLSAGIPFPCRDELGHNQGKDGRWFGRWTWPDQIRPVLRKNGPFRPRHRGNSDRAWWPFGNTCGQLRISCSGSSRCPLRTSSQGGLSSFRPNYESSNTNPRWDRGRADMWHRWARFRSRGGPFEWLWGTVRVLQGSHSVDDESWPWCIKYRYYLSEPEIRRLSIFGAPHRLWPASVVSLRYSWSLPDIFSAAIDHLLRSPGYLVVFLCLLLKSAGSLSADWRPPRRWGLFEGILCSIQLPLSYFPGPHSTELWWKLGSSPSSYWNKYFKAAVRGHLNIVRIVC